MVDASASGHLVADGEYLRAFDLGKLPPTIVTDWAAPPLDGDLPLDVSINVEPLDLAWAKVQLDARRKALESSAPTPGRTVALEQIAGLRMAYERGRTLYLSIRYTERLAEAGAVASVGSRADSYDSALAEAVNGLYKAEVIRKTGPWRSLEQVELATATWVDWWNHRRLHSAI